jgi:hypothetical protein
MSPFPSASIRLRLALASPHSFNRCNRSNHSSSSSFTTTSLPSPTCSIAPNLSFSPLSSPARSKAGLGGSTDLLFPTFAGLRLGLEGPAEGVFAISDSSWPNSAFRRLSFAVVDSRRRSSSVSESDERVWVRMGGRR